MFLLISNIYFFGNNPASGGAGTVEFPYYVTSGNNGIFQVGAAGVYLIDGWITFSGTISAAPSNFVNVLNTVDARSNYTLSKVISPAINSNMGYVYNFFVTVTGSPSSSLNGFYFNVGTISGNLTSCLGVVRGIPVPFGTSPSVFRLRKKKSKEHKVMDDKIADLYQQIASLKLSNNNINRSSPISIDSDEVKIEVIDKDGNPL